MLCLSGLHAQEPKVQAAGEARASEGKTPDPALSALEQNYAQERAAAMRRVLARYVDELEVLEKSLAAAGDTTGAARVRLEHDRVLPALGLSAVSSSDADDFAAFEEEAPVPALKPVPAAPPADFEAILNTLRPAPATTAGDGKTPAGPSASPAGNLKGAKRLLRMGNAKLEGTYDPTAGYEYWYSTKTASWTLNDLPPGSYQLVLRYACHERDRGGGKLKVRFGPAKEIEINISGTGGWKRRRELTIGPFEIKDTRADLIFEARPSSLYLMDMVAVQVQPAGAGAKPSKP